MKFKKEITTYYKAVYNAKMKPFLGFHELKCNLPGLIKEEEIEVREDLYPENVLTILCTPDSGHLFFNVFIGTEFGIYETFIAICHHSGGVTIEFESEVIQPNKSKGSITTIDLNEKQFNKIVSDCLPIVESFLTNLIKLKKNYPCSNNCYFRNKKNKNGKCEKMYISRIEYTPEKNKKRQRIIL